MNESFQFINSDKGAPGFPIRLMVGCLMLKHMYNPGDERIPGYRARDVYFQYFCVGVHFEHKFPFDPGDFVHFRNRVGEDGIAKIFAYNVKLHGVEVSRKSRFVFSDTTVQENNSNHSLNRVPKQSFFRFIFANKKRYVEFERI